MQISPIHSPRTQANHSLTHRLVYFPTTHTPATYICHPPVLATNKNDDSSDAAANYGGATSALGDGKGSRVQHDAVSEEEIDRGWEQKLEVGRVGLIARPCCRRSGFSFSVFVYGMP